MLNENEQLAGTLGDNQMSLLFRISQLLDQSMDLRDVVNPVLEAMAIFLQMRHAVLSLLNRNTDDIAIEAFHGLSTAQAKRGRYKLGEGVTGQVVLKGEQAIIPRTSESPIFLDRTKAGKSDDSSFICVPIKIGNEVVGALSVDKPYTPAADLVEEAQLLSIVASMIAQAVKLRRTAQETRDRLEQENERLRAELRDQFRPSNIIGNSHEMKQVYDQIAKVSNSQATILIEGETGTGKELVAAALHYNSTRARKPFIKAHFAALPETIIESELFGHEKGAFTGALATRKGRFELADGGTIFLDEIGEIPASIQIKLLRVLQEREFERVGGTETIKVNVRIICATNKNLSKMVAEGSFREDLFYRLNVFPIYVPALRKRKTDVVLLSEFFLEKYSAENGKNIKRLSSGVIDMLMAYHWPGNVRELENCIERAVIVAEGDVLHSYHMPPTLQTAETSGTISSGDLKSMVAAYERDLIRDALKSTRGNMAAAARQLQTTQRIMGYKIKQLNVDAKNYTS